MSFASAQDVASVDPAAIKKFAGSIAGRVITPQTPEYDSARRVFNRAFDRNPALIVRCSNPSDVARSLEFGRSRALPIAIRGGGHSRAGFGVCDKGLVIDMSSMNHVEVDSAKLRARAQAGSLVRDFDQATQRVGLATTMGGCPTVGVAGFTLGGGEGLLMSKFGAGCDNLLSAQIVTVDGRQIEASEGSNSDLFWAIRGGGGNFGVVTSLDYRLYRLSDVLSGTLTFAPGRFVELLQAFVKFVSAAPDEMNVVGEVWPSPQGTRFHMMICHCGDPRQGNDLLKPLRAFQPQEDTVRVASYLQTQTSINPYSSAAHFQTNVFLPQFTDAAIQSIDSAAQNAPPNTRVFIVPLYGAISRVAPAATAFPLRQPGYELDIMGRYSSPAEKDAAVQWVVKLRDALHPLASGVYSNQLGETSETLVREAYGSNYRRLAQVKHKYDPDNVLRLNQNVQPGQG